MKKILLASTALFALSAVSAYAADPVQLSLGGFMKQELIYASNSGNFHDADFFQQGFGQVNFNGSTKLDNGITVGVTVETLATQWNDSRNASGNKTAINAPAATTVNGAGNSDVRRAYMTVSSAFGQAILGQREDYGFITGVGTPDVGWGIEGGDWQNAINWPANHAAYGENNNTRYDGRRDKVTIISPMLYGFSLGASYTPDIHIDQTGNLVPASGTDSYSAANTAANAGNANTLINRGDFAGDKYQVGVTYKDKIGPVGLAGNFDFSQYNMANLKTYQAGAQATYGGFTLGGSIFARNIGDNDHVFGQTAANGTLNYATVYSNTESNAIMHTGLNWGVGAAYAIDAYSVSVGYWHDTTKRAASLAGETAAVNYGGAADSTSVYALSGKYVMGPGVDFRTSVYAFELKNNSNYGTVGANSVAKTATSNNGVAVISGMNVAF